MDEIRKRAHALCADGPRIKVEEEGAHVGFSVGGRRFAWLLEDHHGDGRLALNLKAPPGRNEDLAEADPERYFLPSYLGKRGWVGVWLDVDGIDWDAVERLVADAQRA